MDFAKFERDIINPMKERISNLEKDNERMKSLLDETNVRIGEALTILTDRQDTKEK